MLSPELIIGAVAILGLVAAFFYIKGLGKDQAKAEINEDLIDAVKEAKEIDDEASRTSDADKRKWLRKNRR